jgi:glycosyltransferase involved in cell wall biosynthesis
MRRRIAMITQGGIARPGTTGYMPALVHLLTNLSRVYDIWVFGTSGKKGDHGSFRCGDATVVLTEAHFEDSFAGKVFHLGRAFTRVHRGRPFDLVHGQWSIPGGFIAVLLGKLFRIPSVVTIRGADAAAVSRIAYGHLLRPTTRAATLWTCRNADALTTLTKFQAHQLKRFGLDRTDVRVIPTGVDAGVFRPLGRKPPAPPYQLLHVANLTPVKNQKMLLRSFQLITREIDAILTIAGPDYLKGEIQRFAASLSIQDRVRFTGYKEHSLLPELYRKAHLLLHTSYYEGQGIVIAEAAACGTVTCGTEVGLVADLADICTVASPADDPEGLAKNALDLLNDSSRLERLRENGLKWAAEHDIEWTAGKYRELYDEILGLGETTPAGRPGLSVPEAGGGVL